MSHNKIIVDSKGPDSGGNIPLDMSSLITESNIQNNQIIKYNGSEFINSNAGGSALNLKLGFHFYSTAWGQSAKSYLIGDYYSSRRYQGQYYTASGFNFNNATNTNTPQSNTRWQESVDIPSAGKYLFIYSINCRNGTSLTVRCSNNAGEFGVKCIAARTGFQGPFVFGIADCVNNDIVRVVITAKSGNATLMNVEGIRTTSIQIFKLD